jgi:hypothetical protein
MRRNWRKHAIRVLVTLGIVLFVMLAAAEVTIGWNMRVTSQTAQAHFPGRRVEALMAMVACDSCSLQDRNKAVWALGQLDDPRALPVLEKFHTGKPCNHWSQICQKTLQTSLRHLRHQDNNRGESFLWCWMLPAEN